MTQKERERGNAERKAVSVRQEFSRGSAGGLPRHCHGLSDFFQLQKVSHSLSEPES